MSAKRLLASCALGLGSLLLVSIALAQGGGAALTAPQSELRVCASGCLYGDVQSAVNAAGPGDVIEIAGGLYTGGGPQVVTITKTVTLRGGYRGDFAAWNPQAYTTTLNAQGQGRVVVIDGTAAGGAITVTLDGLQLTGGSWSSQESIVLDTTYNWWTAAAGGGMRVQNAHISLLNSRLYNNHTPNGVGSGLAQWLGSFTMRDSIVESNTAGAGRPVRGMFGGGLFLVQCTVDIRDSTLRNNVASTGTYDSDSGYGGGIYLNHATGSIDHTTVTGNVAVGSGPAWGCGGGLAVDFSSLNLSNSTLSGNTATPNTYGDGGGACLYQNGGGAVVLTGNTFQGNYAGRGGTHGYGGGVFSYTPATITGNTFSGNTACTGGAMCRGGGVYLSSAGLFQNNTLVANTAGEAGAGAWFDGSLAVKGNLFQNNVAGTSVGVGDGAGLVANGAVSLVRNTIQDNSAGYCGGGVASNGLALEDGDVVRHNTARLGGGLCIRGNAGGTNYRNLVVLDNQASVNGSGVYIDRGTATGTINLAHLTIGSNSGGDGAGVYVYRGAAAFANTIEYNQLVGVQNVSGSPAFNHTLRYQVTTATIGTVSDTYAIAGDPKLAPDGYHLTPGSAAIDQGGSAGVTDDVDGGPRPQGGAPDLGAHESPFTAGTGSGLQVSKLAGSPRWVMTWDLSGRATAMRLEQDYLIPFSYGGTAASPAVPAYTIRDQLPAGLQLSSQEATPVMGFSQAGNQLTWSSTAPLAPGGAGWVGMVGKSAAIQPGTPLQNSAAMTYTISGQVTSVPLQAGSQVPERPLMPPMVTSPVDGEMCLDLQGRLEAHGLTYALYPVQLYENDALKATATADSSGVFTLTWTSALTFTNSTSVNLYTRVCDPVQTANCSAPSRTVHIDYPLANWCPQRSYWEGDVHNVHYVFHFVNDQGRYATNDFELPGVYGFANTLLHLYSCCDRATNPFTVQADGTVYTGPTSHDGRMWTFNIGAAHDVIVQSQCQVGGSPPGHGKVLIDPDGFVFDATQGGHYDAVTGVFAPVQALSGITVTAYVSVTEWNTWAPWPAQLYNNQINPQVTGASGYFAFFTPPGLYYLQATAPSSGGAGFQSWRSPLIQVIAQPVHANAPLTPLPAGAPRMVQLTPYGPSPATAVVPRGGSVAWQATLNAGAGPAALTAAMANPKLQPLSAPYAITSTADFDGGMLGPGQLYRRQFSQPGTYSYTDGAGHSGRVVVAPFSLYLPLSRR